MNSLSRRMRAFLAPIRETSSVVWAGVKASILVCLVGVFGCWRGWRNGKWGYELLINLTITLSLINHFHLVKLESVALAFISTNASLCQYLSHSESGECTPHVIWSRTWGRKTCLHVRFLLISKDIPDSCVRVLLITCYYSVNIGSFTSTRLGMTGICGRMLPAP